MKKTAILVASLCVAGTASAHSGVDLYGVIDMGVAHFAGGAYGSTTMLASGYQASDRIGVKGNEELGSGLDVFFQAETGFCGNGSPQAGNMNIGVPLSNSKAGSGPFCTGGGFMQRTSNLGIRGSFGSLEAGRLYAQSFFIAASADPLGAWVQNVLFPVPYFRFSQAIQYATPDIAGVTGVAQYALGGQSGNTSADTGYDLALRYHHQALGLALGYFDYKPAYAGSTPAAPLVGNDKFVQLEGSYDFRLAKLIGYWSKMSSEHGLAINTGEASKNAHIWALALTVPLRAGTLMTSYSAYDDTDVSARNARQYTLGYVYPISLSTNVYASYAHISNNAQQSFAVADATDFGFAPEAGHDSSGFAIGIKHSF